MTVTPYVNGTSLIELARRAERRPAAEGGEPQLAGAYAGLVVDSRGQWTHFYLDEHAESWFGDGDSCLLGCTCGSAGCWPLTARVSVHSDHVMWTDFRTGHRAWDLSRRLGPFTFLRAQYEMALTNPQ